MRHHHGLHPKWDVFEAAWMHWEGEAGENGAAQQAVAGRLLGKQSPRGSSQRELIVPVVRGWHSSLQCTESLGKHSLSPRAGSTGPSLQTLF